MGNVIKLKFSIISLSKLAT